MGRLRQERHIVVEHEHRCTTARIDSVTAEELFLTVSWPVRAAGNVVTLHVRHHQLEARVLHEHGGQMHLIAVRTSGWPIEVRWALTDAVEPSQAA